MKATPQTFVLTAEHLPVIGDAHPLRKPYSRYLFTATIIAAMIHLAGFGGWLAARTFKPEPKHAPIVRVVKIADLGVPPSLTQNAAAPVNVAAQVAPPSIGVPEPVPDFQAPNLTMASQEEMAAALAPTDLSSLGSGSGDSLVVDLDALSRDRSPSPDEFVAVEEMPAIIQSAAPVYPEMARQAEVEGTVMLRLLVGKDGKVKDAIVTQGVTMLNDAAIEAARKFVFRPALQQHRPVEVWVQLPMKFTLH
jgi:protein TonB